MRYFNVEQGSDDWFELRKGVPTASNFDKILTPKTGKLSAQAGDYINELIGESISLIPPEGVENFTNRAIRWGQQCEAEAKHFYAYEKGVAVFDGGFCMTDDGRFGSSPDFLVGLDFLPEAIRCDKGEYWQASVAGAGELKCPQSGTQIRYVLAQELPSEYRCQVHGHLIVTGAPWCDFLSYSPGCPPFLTRVVPDEFTDKLRVALEEFWDRYQEAWQKVKGVA